MAEDGIGPRGSMVLLAQARPADQGGNPLPGGTVRFVATSPVEAGRWLRRTGRVWAGGMHTQARGASW
eukprot:4535719-Alexandrium_andersonii.AAC.1